MAELRVFMLDLMSFALRQNGMWVVLPDARSQRQEFVHYPIVLFDIPAQTGSDWEEIRGKLNLKKASDKHAWLLDREDILIPRQEHASSIKVTSQPGIKGYPDTSNAREFSWVPLMREVFSRCSDMEPLLTPNDPRNPLPSEAAARMLLSQGRLETATFVKHLKTTEPNKIVEFEFFPRGQGDRALAELLVATIPLDVPRITISAFNHQTRGERWVTLDAVDGYVNMLVANISPILEDKPMDGRHFMLYYKLSTAPGEIGPTPMEVSKKVVEGVELPYPSFVDLVHDIKKGGESRPICTSVQFN